MPVDFAAAEALLGASVRRCLNNATLLMADATAVDGMLRNVPREAYVGMGVAARNIEFTCALADVPETLSWLQFFERTAEQLDEAAAVSIIYRGVATAYKIAERMPDDIHLQSANFALRLA